MTTSIGLTANMKSTVIDSTSDHLIFPFAKKLTTKAINFSFFSS